MSTALLWTPKSQIPSTAAPINAVIDARRASLCLMFVFIGASKMTGGEALAPPRPSL